MADLSNEGHRLVALNTIERMQGLCESLGWVAARESMTAVSIILIHVEATLKSLYNLTSQLDETLLEERLTFVVNVLNDTWEYMSEISLFIGLEELTEDYARIPLNVHKLYLEVNK